MTKQDLKLGQMFQCKSKGIDEIVEVVDVQLDAIIQTITLKIITGCEWIDEGLINSDGTFNFPLNLFINYYELQ